MTQAVRRIKSYRKTDLKKAAGDQGKTGWVTRGREYPGLLKKTGE